ncbi:MAG: type II toxin-antitoxin system PemK/MazF family toxin [Puniceicoccaceae bacterium]|nr:MAG: type II toxin-antitoxin system PemK/MazF family toxin [Puniceicoccaceae bacterium]
MKVERYSIYWVDLNPVIGSEISKVRPAVVISDDLMNLHLQTVVVCPLTTKLHPTWRSRIVIECAGKPSEIAVDQIRTVSKQRLRHAIDKLDPAEAEELRQLIVEMYGMA